MRNELLDSVNIGFARRLYDAVSSRQLIVNSPYIYPRVLTVDDDHAREAYPMFFKQCFGIDTIPAGSDAEAQFELMRIADSQEALDAVTTDLRHPANGGLYLVDYIRNLRDEVVMAGGIRLRHIPIVVITACDGSEDIERIHRIDRNIRVLSKPEHLNEIGKAIDDAICDFRSAILEEVHHIGLAIIWGGGRFSVLSCYVQTKETIQEGKYFAGSLPQISQGYCRLVLVAERLTVAEHSVAELEQLINAPTSKERDLQEFFARHPEFLYRSNYSSHWAEPVLRSEKTTLRPDFVLKPRVLPQDPGQWEILDLKRSDVVLTTAHPRHPDLTAAVHHGCAQLRNYATFFADHRNHEQLRRQFGGIVPQPKLALVIGRFAANDVDKLGKLRKMVPDVQILTYDEILAFRRTEVEYQNWRRQSN